MALHRPSRRHINQLHAEIGEIGTNSRSIAAHSGKDGRPAPIMNALLRLWDCGRLRALHRLTRCRHQAGPRGVEPGDVLAQSARAHGGMVRCRGCGRRAPLLEPVAPVRKQAFVGGLV